LLLGGLDVRQDFIEQDEYITNQPPYFLLLITGVEGGASSLVHESSEPTDSFINQFRHLRRLLVASSPLLDRITSALSLAWIEPAALLDTLKPRLLPNFIIRRK
jgi:hypothetical protein